MARDTVILGPFGGLYNRLSATVPDNRATRMRNVRCVTDGLLAPRYGFRIVADRPAGVTDFGACGLSFLRGYSSADNGALEEVVAIETRDGVTRPYQINVATGARTEIKDGATSLNLPAGKYKAVTFNEYAYFINPESNTPLYRHKIGDLTSWVTLVNTAYTPPPVAPELTVSPTPVALRNIVKGAGADTIAVSSTDGISGAATTATSAGVLEVSGTNLDNGVPHRTVTEIVFNASENWAAHGYIAFEVLGGVVFPFLERTNVAIEVKIAGSWVALSTKEVFESGATSVLIIGRLKGTTGANAVDGVRFTIGGYVQRYASGICYKVNPFKLGGVFMEALDATKRLWDGLPGDADGVEYAARYCQAAGAAPQSAIVRASLNYLAAAGNLLALYGVRLGGRAALSVVAQDTGTYSHVEFLRQDRAKNKWYRVGIVANSGTPRYTDALEDYEVAAPLVEVTLGAGGSTDTQPPFSTRGIVDAFPFRGRMVWLRKGGAGNVSHSRIGDAEETYDAANPPVSGDVGAPVDFDLAEDLADEPVLGLSIDNGNIIIGKKGAYAHAYNQNGVLTDYQRVQGSTGAAGRFAYAPVVVDSRPGMAYLDVSGSVVMMTLAGAFSEDASVRPEELSFDIYKYARAFLFEEQIAEFGYADLSGVVMGWDQFDSALWVVYGRRALVLRPGNPNPQWEEYEYQLTNPLGSATVSACQEPGAYGASASSLLDASIAWGGLPNVYASDDLPAVTDSFGFGTLLKSHTLRVAGMQSASPLNPAAVITSVKFLIEHSKTGDLGVVLKKVVPRINAVAGADLATGAAVPTVDTTVEYALATLPTAAQINGGLVDADIQYEQETWLPAWNDPANYNIVVTGAGSAAMVVTATYTAGGAKPPRVYLDILSTVTGTIVFDFGSVPGSIEGSATLDNGQGEAGTGAVSHQASIVPPGGDPPAGEGDWPYTRSSTVKTAVALVAGVGSVTITRSGSGTCHVTGGTFTNPRVNITYAGSAAVVAAVAAVVRVDRVNIKPCYDLTISIPEMLSGVGWDAGVWTPDRQALLQRSTGQIDELEYDSQRKEYIGGTLRDGGRAMPPGYWRTKLNVLDRTRVHQMEVDQIADAEIVAAAGSALRTIPSGMRWAKFGVTDQGYAQEIGVDITETVSGVRAVRVLVDLLNDRKTR